MPKSIANDGDDMFSEKLNKLMSSLDINIKYLAGQMECDRSYIQRLCSGTRVPKQNGTGAYNLADGLYKAASGTEKIGELCGIIGCDAFSSGGRIRAAVVEYLYDGETEENVRSRRSYISDTSAAAYSTFGTRLDSIMTLTGLSNIRLGKQVNTDPSYISRFRSGVRSPKNNPQMMNDIAEALLDRLIEHKKLPALEKLMDLSPNALDNREAAFEMFYDWLYESNNNDSAVLIEGLLDHISGFRAGAGESPLSFEQAVDSAVLSDDSSEYYGSDGLRRAVIRFLGNVVTLRPEKIYLYSDQKMDWITADSEFRIKWASLMMMCVNNGTQIHIIHNINRSMSEMTDAIKSWLPLYPSGMIHAYYCKPQINVRFSTTLFLCPEHFCISGSNVTGTENNIGMYRYDTGREQLYAHQAAYSSLLERSSPLVRFISTADADISVKADPSSVTVISGTLTFATMPDSLIRRKAPDLTATRLGISAVNELYECVYLPADEELFGGRVTMDIPGRAAVYTTEEYAEHIGNILKLLESRQGYRLCVLPQPPFDDMKMIIAKNIVAVSRLKPPFMTFVFQHPDMCRAFKSYADSVKKQYGKHIANVRQTLEKYL